MISDRVAMATPHWYHQHRAAHYNPDEAVPVEAEGVVALESRFRIELSVPRIPSWARSSAAERSAHNRLVPGSNPGGPTSLNFSTQASSIIITPEGAGGFSGGGFFRGGGFQNDQQSS